MPKSYTAKNIDPAKFEEALQSHLSQCKDQEKSAIEKAKARMQGVDDTITAVISMLHCSNYEDAVEDTDAYNVGFCTACDVIGRALGLTTDDLLPSSEGTYTEKASRLIQRIQSVFGTDKDTD